MEILIVGGGLTGTTLASAQRTNFAHLPDAAKLVLAAWMRAGRLEIFTFLVVLAPSFWRR